MFYTNIAYKNTRIYFTIYMSTTYKPLTIYKASAGSGKTFTLAIEYISLLIANPQNFRYILAVTFTNKATQEMKQRILSQLYGIANGLSESDNYFLKIKERHPNFDEQEIRNRATEALYLIIHQYHWFRVETIDSFFQRILRNLAHELGLTANMQVILNDLDVKDEAVDNIIENISQDNDPLLSWIMDFVNEKLEQDQSWNVIKPIKEFGKNILKDFYKDHQKELHSIMNNPAFFKDYTSKLRKKRDKAIDLMAQYTKKFKDFVDVNNLTEKDFYQGGKGVPGYFKKLENADLFTQKSKILNSYVTKGINNSEELVKKDNIDKPESKLIIKEVGPLLLKAEEDRKQAAITVNSVDLALKNINELRLLGRIEAEFQSINEANGQYPLSNTQKLLNSLIDKQDSPFIYEKIGGQLRYIMIDEFQDTSYIQWTNFKVLLDDCIAHQAGSLIVGDVKQSIYRWRDGDWHLLNSLNEKSNSAIQVKHLNTNYRSQRNIIHFNNTFFTATAQLVSNKIKAELEKDQIPMEIIQQVDEITMAYEDVSQQIPANKENMGLVKITLLPSNDYENEMICQVKETIEYLLSNNIKTSDIAIIARKNNHIQILASYFQQNPIEVNGKQQMVNMVSNEAFQLNSSMAVRTIITAMRVLIHPQDKLTMASLIKMSQRIIHRDENIDDASLFARKSEEELKRLLPAEMNNAWDELISTPLIDLAEQLYSIFKLNRLDNESAYICTFFDELTEYLQKHVAGIEEFLQEWDNTIYKNSINSDDIDGIRILTIHKSKGLEFDNVIVPFCDWDVEKNTNILWTETECAPYNELPVIPVNLSREKLKESIFRNQYLNEHINNNVDSLNLLYVTFTRAAKNLFIIGRTRSAKYISKLLHEVIKCEYTNKNGENTKFQEELENSLFEEDEDKSIRFEYGSLCPSEEIEERNTKNVFLQKEIELNIKGQSYHSEPHFKQSNASKDFVTPADELEEKLKKQAYIETGNILHALFASIRNSEDIDKAIDQLEFDGVLYNKPMTRQELRNYIDRALENKQIAEWFSSQWKVFNECSILYYDEEQGQVRERRPDRVIYDGKQMTVIDFKTGKQLERHQEQVRQYMNLLYDMGYQNISGYLWYIQNNNIVKVSL